MNSEAFELVLEKGEMNLELWSECSTDQISTFFVKYPESIRSLLDEQSRALEFEKYTYKEKRLGSGDPYITESFYNLIEEIIKGIKLGLDDVWFDYALSHVKDLRVKYFNEYMKHVSREI